MLVLVLFFGKVVKGLASGSKATDSRLLTLGGKDF